MLQLLTSAELALFSQVPETDLVDLAVELDIPVGETVARPELLSHVVQQLSDLARREGLPFSCYDQDDLEQLEPDHRAALARAVGTAADPRALVKAGQKVYKRYRRLRPRSQVPLLLPMLLPALARHLASSRED